VIQILIAKPVYKFIALQYMKERSHTNVRCVREVFHLKKTFMKKKSHMSVIFVIQVIEVELNESQKNMFMKRRSHTNVRCFILKQHYVNL
jgi:hypothetical protein